MYGSTVPFGPGVPWAASGGTGARSAAGRRAPGTVEDGAPSEAVTYEPIDYWSRLHARGDLSAVGQSALPAELNAWLYRALARNVRRFLRSARLAVPERVFDVGSGTGFWPRFWHRLGARRVDGCDLVPEAVERLRASELGRAGRFVVADVSRPEQLPDETYPLVSCMNVLLHVVADGPFERALGGIARLVEPGGVLLLVEPILLDARFERPYEPGRASRARPLERYLGPLEAAGLRLERLAPAVVLAN
ncbi:MAG TPA: class I SAM-dependent methyltransferase, partial [Candidatus Limnocylindrales bacterium]|nr:class I SAM-dependent methyltransferase [Candidatus Limnocylindrales bacterium]